MDSADAANLIAEIHEERAENEASEHFRNRAALLIAVLAAVLAIGGLGGGNATDDMIANNIKASDTWAFFQTKSVRQTMYKLAVQDLEIELTASALTPSMRAATESRIKHYHTTIARYDSEPAKDAQNDPLRGEGKRELTAQAEAYEAAFAQAAARDNNFDFAEVALQLALILGSVAILALNRWIFVLAVAFGSIGALLTINGFCVNRAAPVSTGHPRRGAVHLGRKAVANFRRGFFGIAPCRSPASSAFLLLGLVGCTEPEVDRIKDPVKKAEHSCTYVLERHLAKPAELSPDGVLRRRVAKFQPPRIQRAGDQINFFWAHGAIKRLDTLEIHGGDCSMLVSRQFVIKATLDGRSLHAGFSF